MGNELAVQGLAAFAEHERCELGQPIDESGGRSAAGQAAGNALQCPGRRAGERASAQPAQHPGRAAQDAPGPGAGPISSVAVEELVAAVPGQAHGDVASRKLADEHGGDLR